MKEIAKWNKKMSACDVHSFPGTTFIMDVKRVFQDDTRNLIGSAIMEDLFKPIKFRLTSRFPRLTSL